ncbi:MAG: toprim domain-containing protein [Bacteroidales bacterium]|nr:toprim domain-containing protein [Bacteroidales bacterium]
MAERNSRAGREDGMSAELRGMYARCREEINSRPLTAFYPLEKSRGRQMYNCPICGSGSGPNHTGALRLSEPNAGTRAWHCMCFANRCFGEKGTDTLGALRILNKGISEWQLFQQLNLHAFDPSLAAAGRRKTAAQPVNDALKRQMAQWEKAADTADACARYLASRGLTKETAARFRIGYDPAHYFGSLGRSEAAVIIPYPGRTYYAARAIKEKAFDKPRTAQAGPEPLFETEPHVLAADQPVFIVESQICAISIAQCGGAAIALGNTGSGRLLDALAEERPAHPLILCLDNDPQTDPEIPEKGPKAQAELAEALREREIPFIEYNIAGEAKDPNEALTRDGAQFLRRLGAAKQEAICEEKRRGEEAREREAEEIRQAELEREARRLDYEKEAAGNSMEALSAEIDRATVQTAISTGFEDLDAMLDGGFYPGLYIVGAITSLGKTSFVLQVADAMAAKGQDVLFFSLEMSRFELMAKSVSRLTYVLSRQRGNGTTLAKTTRGVLTGKRYADYSERELALLDEAWRAYSENTRHLWLIEGVGDVSVEQIRERVDRHIAMTGRMPVVIVDYLQIITPVDIRATDKQNTDRNVLALKRLSRDKTLTVIGISSLNRENYQSPINMAAFKEAGSIEYGSDCLIGLQYDGMDYQEGEADKVRDKRIREMLQENERLAKDGKPILIQLKILKNRNGVRGTSAPFHYRPMFNHFEQLPRGFIPVNENDPFKGLSLVKLKS